MLDIESLHEIYCKEKEKKTKEG